MACAVQVLTHYQTYPERPPGADHPPKKVCNLDPMAPRSWRARLRGLFASRSDYCTKLASDALFARVFARVARAVIGEGRAMGVESRGCLDTACRRVGSKT